jgi:tetratricopeptide (TPR) repeat protein
MPRIHPKPDVIDRMVELVPELRLKVLRHLCECPTCHALWIGETAEEEQGAAPADGGRVLTWRPPVEAYDTVVDRVLRGIQIRFQEAERERAAAPALLDELRRHPPERRSWWLAQSGRFHSLPVLDSILRVADEEAFRNARDAEGWAELALGLADHLDPQQIGERVIEDARARCWTSIANARRVASDLLGSEQAFRAAEAHLRLGSRDPLVRGHVLSYKASLRRAQSRYTESVSLLRRSISIWSGIGERRRFIDDLLKWVLVCQDEGDPHQALALLRKAMALVGPDQDARLRLIIRHNLIVCLIELGHLREARALLSRSRFLYQRFPDSLLQLRRRWMEAVIASRFGDLPRAIRLLARVRVGYARRGDGYSAALASLELGTLYARIGRTGMARRLAREVLPLVRSRGMQLDTLAALILLLQPPAA